MPPNKFTLKVTKKDSDPQTFEFEQDEIFIGSVYTLNDLVINTVGIASQQARIWRDDQGYFLQNLCGSEILVGRSQSLAQDASARLESGIEIDMGSISVAFFEGETHGAGVDKKNGNRKSAKSLLRMFGIGAVGLGVVLILLMFATGGKGMETRSGDSSLSSASMPIELPAKGKYGYNETDKGHLDKAVFSFRTEAINVELFYTPGKIGSDKELSIQLNGQPIGYAPKEEKDWGEETALRLPRGLLKKQGDNQLVFDNLRNPPQRHQWGVQNIGIRDLPVDLCDRDEAHRLIDLGDELYQQKTISKGNLFLAHQYYYDAAVRIQDCSNKDDFYKHVRLKKGTVKQELDALYNNLKFDYKKSYKMERYKNCRSILKDIMDYIPDESDKRHQEASKMFEKYNQVLNARRK